MANDSKDNKDQAELTDDQLHAYLQGQHEVSETYRVLGDEQPSAQLDESILSAAKAELETAQGETSTQHNGFSIFKRWPANYYPIAASVLIVMVVTTMYLGNEPRRQIEALKNEVNPNTVNILQEQQSPAAEAEEIIVVPDANENASDLGQQVEARQQQLLAPQAQPVQTPEIDALADGATVDSDSALAREPLSPAIQVETSAVVTASDENVSALRLRAEAPQVAVPEQVLELEDATDNVIVDNEGVVEEIVVTASRIISDDSVSAFAAFESINPEYRNSVDDWLEEILFLSEEDTEAEQIERELFIAAHPEIDLDLALSELAEGL